MMFNISIIVHTKRDGLPGVDLMMDMNYELERN